VKRERSLWPLTHGHQHALSAAKALRERSAQPGKAGDMEELRSQVLEFLDLELQGHFKAEEDLLDLLSAALPPGDPDVVRLKTDHRTLGQLARKGSREDLLRFSDLLVKHVRFEEDVLFGRIEKALSVGEEAKVSAILRQAAPPKVCPGLLAPRKG